MKLNLLKKAISLFLSLILLVLLVACAKADKSSGKFGEDIPVEVSDFIVEYYEAFKKSAGDARQYRYYIDDIEREADYGNSPDLRVLDYEIIDGEKLSDDLYAFKVLSLNEYMPQEKIDRKEYDTYYNFVARIDGKWLICASKYSIPDDMKEGIDFDRFQNSGTVIGSFNGRDLVLVD